MSSTTSSSILCVPTLSQRQHQQQQRPHQQQQQHKQQPEDAAINSPLSAAIRETLSVLQQRLDCVSPTATHMDDRSSSVNSLFFQGATGDCAAPFRYADDMSDSGSTVMLDNYNGIEQLRRLSSWGTYGTTNSADLISQAQYTPLPFPQYDDHGKPIDPLIYERALEQRRRRSHSNNSHRSNGRSRPKTVKFAYPPITSLRQCPRHDDPDLIADLFFTSSELDQYEEDRRQTTMVDDVEIVAVSTSSLSRDEGSANGDEDTSYDNKKFGRYVPSPTKKGAGNKQRHGSKGGTSYSSGVGTAPPSLSGSASTSQKQQQQQHQQQHQHQQLPQDQQQHQQHSPTPPQHPATTSPKRLLKSVQIFLRERSTGNV